MEQINMGDVLERRIRLPSISHTFYVYIEQEQEDCIEAREIIDQIIYNWSKTQIAAFVHELLLDCDIDVSQAVLKVTRSILSEEQVEEVNSEVAELSWESEI